MAYVWRSYTRLLERHPWRTTAATTGTLMAAGDIISQLAVEKKYKDYDPIRTARFLILGCFVIGPMLRFWYKSLDKMFAGKKAAPLKMMVTDQAFGAPVVLFTFLSGMGVMRGESLDGIKYKLQRDYIPVMLANYKIWPAAQSINFYFLPLQHRVLFVNTISLGWNTYLAWKSEQK